MTGCQPRPVRPRAYWDRALRVVRDWNSNQILSEYEGCCMVYLDTRGPVFLYTFLQNGERFWQEEEPVLQGIGSSSSELEI
ncbi:MAG TPA: hypothetical protein VFA89_24120 [Terriglobales bacterium]|nr:hypothetical protein [Terriglobales bacterium]